MEVAPHRDIYSKLYIKKKRFKDWKKNECAQGLSQDSSTLKSLQTFVFFLWVTVCNRSLQLNAQISHTGFHFKRTPYGKENPVGMDSKAIHFIWTALDTGDKTCISGPMSPVMNASDKSFREGMKCGSYLWVLKQIGVAFGLGKEARHNMDAHCWVTSWDL